MEKATVQWYDASAFQYPNLGSWVCNLDAGTQFRTALLLSVS